MKHIIAQMACSESDIILGLVSEYEEHSYAKMKMGEFVPKVEGDEPISNHRNSGSVGLDTRNQEACEYEKLKKEVLEMLDITIREKQY